MGCCIILLVFVKCVLLISVIGVRISQQHIVLFLDGTQFTCYYTTCILTIDSGTLLVISLSNK